MIREISEISEIFLGIGEPYPKAAIVDFITGTTGKEKSYWNNKSDAIYYSYARAVKEKNYPVWHINDPTGTAKITDYVTAETGLNRNDVYQYLLSLYTMANMGKIKTEIWNPAGAFSQYGASQITEKIKEFISPVTDTAAAPAKKLMTGLLIAATIATIGTFASKSFIKEKLKGR